MTIAELESLLTNHRVTIDEWRGGVGYFRDLYVGTGQDLYTLEKLRQELRTHRVISLIERVNVPEHPACGKQYLCIPSFWWK